MKPLFEVGEEVILQSPKNVESNGPAVVLKGPIYDEELQQCAHCGNTGITDFDGPDICYYLSTSHPEDCCILWCQTSLRKKHRPSDKTFDQLMSEVFGCEV